MQCNVMQCTTHFRPAATECRRDGLYGRRIVGVVRCQAENYGGGAQLAGGCERVDWSGFVYMILALEWDDVLLEVVLAV
jgi:hypothetical protein